VNARAQGRARGGRAAPGPYLLARESADALRTRIGAVPRIAIVLGSGLGGLVDRLSETQAIPYRELLHFPLPTVQGHTGQLVLGRLAGVPVAALQGRIHFYEGSGLAQVVHPVRVLGLLGAEILIVTNAAGGLDATYQAGDLMLLRDHIGLATMAGFNPLVGPNDEDVGPRFPAMTHSYDPGLRAHARAVAAEHGIPLREGVYIMVAGPTFETPAELAFLRQCGADAVGMSSVPEVIAARHMGLRVLAVSCITNVTLPAGAVEPPVPSHQEVLATADAAGARLADLVAGVVARLGAEADQPVT
jgi:purine-nucleoside phosphorylase